jgi:hypothetical protein
MARLGIDLGVLEARRLPDPRVPDCPGAMLRLTRHDYDSYVQGGELFETARKDIPFDAYGSARVRCSQFVAEIPRTSGGHKLFYGLCHSCSGLELRNRQDLSERAKARGDR